MLSRPAEHMAAIYHARIGALHDSLQDEATKTEAAETIRALVSQVVLMPEGSELNILLCGDLAAMLAFAAGKKKPHLVAEMGSQYSLVAGTLNQRYRRHRLSGPFASLIERTIPKLAA